MEKSNIIWFSIVTKIFVIKRSTIQILLMETVRTETSSAAFLLSESASSFRENIEILCSDIGYDNYMNISGQY